MDTLSAQLALDQDNPSVTEDPFKKGSVTRNFDVFFFDSQYKLLNNHKICHWFELCIADVTSPWCTENAFD